MNGELYTLIAMAARYWFCALMVLIAFRAWRITVVDNRRAALLRAWSPETGCIGEFVINPGRTKRQLSVPVPREGVLGSSRRADVRVSGKDVARFHLTLEQREGGLLVRPCGKNRAVLNEAHTGDML
ncbi:MAG: FHA domain-containing protein, partial [Eubacteriales bacterium]|nr:FHA domain-containing protein [Eubacteriales bacterium]